MNLSSTHPLKIFFIPFKVFVVYFDQNLGAVHSKLWSKYTTSIGTKSKQIIHMCNRPYILILSSVWYKQANKSLEQVYDMI